MSDELANETRKKIATGIDSADCPATNNLRASSNEWPRAPAHLWGGEMMSNRRVRATPLVAAGVHAIAWLAVSTVAGRAIPVRDAPIVGEPFDVEILSDSPQEQSVSGTGVVHTPSTSGLRTASTRPLRADRSESGDRSSGSPNDADSFAASGDATTPATTETKRSLSLAELGIGPPGHAQVMKALPHSHDGGAFDPTSLGQALRNADVARGFGRTGVVSEAVRTALMRSSVLGFAVILITTDERGYAVRANVSDSTADRAEWTTMAENALAELAQKPLVTTGVFRIYADARMLLPSGATGGPTAGLGGAVFDLSDIGAKPKRLVTARVTAVSSF